MRIIPPTEAQARADLAAAFRWAAQLDWHESIANHFSVAVSEDARDESSAEGPDAPDPTAWYLHAHLHRRLPQARCVLHTHMPRATALLAHDKSVRMMGNHGVLVVGPSIAEAFDDLYYRERAAKV